MAALALLPLLMLGACTNSNRSSYNGTLKGSSTSSGSGSSTSTSISTSVTTFKIGTVTISQTGSSSSSSALVFFDMTGMTRMISEFCSLASPKLCNCQYSWQETNSTGNTSVTVPRKIATKITNVQNSLVSCEVPTAYFQEVPSGAIVKVTVIPAPGNGGAFTVTPYSQVKGNVSPTGNFQDSEGRKFQNIYRYTCHDRNVRGLAVKSRKAQNTFTRGNNTTEGEFTMASQFCKSRGRDGSGNDVDGCQSQLLVGTGQSAQSYWYNLYMKSSDQNINQSNSAFICPAILEPPFNDGNLNGTQGTRFPLDASFALSHTATGNFTVGVEARSRISSQNADFVGNQSCSTSQNNNNQGVQVPGNALITSCLGFAAKPNTDGTCPYFTDSNGQIRMTYRLRRYTALYPLLWDTTGANMPNEGVKTDQIYVLDRPVTSNLADPLKPFTIRGPKPCPFSWYDWSNATGLGPAYVPTNHSGWNNVNPDSVQFPNTDEFTALGLESSCSAVLPVLNSTRDVISLATLHLSNPVFKTRHVRPGRAWAPTYLEDTDFQACAPDADPHREPPLNVVKNGSNGVIGWCADVYPNKNEALNLTTQSWAGQNTRTVPFVPGGDPYERYPLGSTKTYVEQAIRNDSTYGCLLTFDAGNGKAGKQSPQGGCCSGLGFTSGIGLNASTHLEPSQTTLSPCLTPAY